MRHQRTLAQFTPGVSGILLLAASVLVVGCEQPALLQPEASTGIHFTDVSASTGIEFKTTFGKQPSTQILEVKGGGLALIDYDADGDLDIFVPNGATMAAPQAGPGCRLFENTGELHFRDVTASAGLTFSRWGVGVAVADYDSDGHQDLFIACYGRNALLRNKGDGTFEEVTEAAGVAGDAWSVAPAFGDLDGDGDLDLYVANYLEFDIAHPPAPSTFKGAPVFTGPRGLTPSQDELYENLGNGRFRLASLESGCHVPSAGYGLGAVILDFNGDGRQDIYVGNDSTPNFLFLGQGGLHFDEVGLKSGLAANIYGSTQATMGIAIGDVSGNGYPDVFTSNFSNDSNTLHINKQGRFYDDQTASYGLGMVAFPYVGWACGLYDFDGDSDEDLLVFNGHVYPNATCVLMDADFNETPLLYTRQGRRFLQLSPAESGAWLSEPHCDRGAAFGDLDGDGDVDVVVLEFNGPLRILRNDSAGHDWLIVQLEGGGLGSKIELVHGDTRQTRWIYSGGSFASASEQAAHFGLPGSSSEVHLTVTWPSGQVTEVPRVSPNQRIKVGRD